MTETGVLQPRVWSAPALTFDTIGWGSMTLFELTSLEGALSTLFRSSSDFVLCIVCR